MELNKWNKNNENDKIWWLNNSVDTVGVWIFSFDKKTEFNMFSDYPNKLSKKQVEVFDNENPYWADFFSDRK